MIFLLFFSHSQSDFKSSAPDCNRDWPALVMFVLPFTRSRSLCRAGCQPELNGWGCRLTPLRGLAHGYTGGSGGKREVEGPSIPSYVPLAYLPLGRGVKPLLGVLDVRWAPCWHPWAQVGCWARFMLWCPSNRDVTSFIFPIFHLSHLNIGLWELSDGSIVLALSY